MCGKGRGWLNLCGPSGGMWTLVGKMMEGIIISGKGDDMYELGNHTFKIGVSHELSSQKPKGQ